MPNGKHMAGPEDEGALTTLPEDLLRSGKTLQRIGTPFVTAMTVQKPRDLDKVVAAMAREAEYAGDAFWYSWVLKGSGERIEGASIGLANSLAREWGNCAVTVQLDETDEAFYITARFIDLEKGSQMERPFRQRKSAIQGKYDPDRKLDMALQIGASKAIRNVVVNAVPRWLVDQVIEQAKEAVIKKIDPKKLQEYAANAVSSFGELGVTPEQLVAKAKKPIAQWTTRDIANFRADWKALHNGDVSLTDLFPAPEVKAAEGAVKLDDALAATAKTETQPPPAEKKPEVVAELSGQRPITTEEAQRIKERDIAEAAGKPPPPAAPPAKKEPPKKGPGDNLFTK